VKTKTLIRESRGCYHACYVGIACVTPLLGCTARTIPASARHAPLIAARYEIFSGDREEAARTQERLALDFRQLRELGFNAVWPDSAAENMCNIARQSAQAAGLRAILSDRAIDHYITFGRFPAGIASTAALAAARVPVLRDHSPALVLALPPFPQGEMIARVADVVQHAAALQPPCEAFVVGYATDAIRFAALRTLWYAAWPQPGVSLRYDGPGPRMVLVLGQGNAGESAWSESAMRLAYDRGLAAGLTDGALLWRFRSWPGEMNGVADADGRLTSGTAVAIRSITRAATGSSALLIGARCIPQEAVTIDSARVRCTSYQRQGRRFIMVHNEDAEHFGRGTLRVPPALAGRPVSRVVAQDTGARYLRAEGTLTIPIHLAPAGAIVFEVH
jgi:hypothetical protein